MNIRVDGKKIAEKILSTLKQQVLKSKEVPTLTVFTCEPNFETQLFLKRKCQAAESVGIPVQVIEFDRESGTHEILMSISHLLPSTDGVIVQLPFPARIDTKKILSAIPPTRDVDALLYDGEDDEVLPPVVGAIRVILEEHQISLKGKQVVVVGKGRLVGAPSVVWAQQQGAEVECIGTAATFDPDIIKMADVLITGAGQPGLITKDMVKPGVVILDAGTSEEGGVLKGDVDPTCAEKASLYTPVPGGIGPITVAVLLQNLVTLKNRQ